MRVAFLGNADLSVPPLEALAGSAHAPVMVATRAPRPAGRGGRPTSTPVAEAARRLDLPLAEVDTVKAGPGFDAIAEARPDVLTVVAYGEILPRAVLELPTLIPVNVHFSLLPELRGAAPVQRALMEGLAVTGVTTLRMDEGMDTGPILLQQEEAVAETDDAGSLGARLAAIGGRLLVDTLDRLEARALGETPQDEARATYAPKIRPEDEVIDWSRPPESIVRMIRALAPTPGARTTFRRKTLKVFGAELRSPYFPPTHIPGPGTVVPFRKGGGPTLLRVSTGDLGVVVLTHVALEGKRRISGEEFVRGYRPEAGEVLGA